MSQAHTPRLHYEVWRHARTHSHRKLSQLTHYDTTSIYCIFMLYLAEYILINYVLLYRVWQKVMWTVFVEKHYISQGIQLCLCLYWIHKDKYNLFCKHVCYRYCIICQICNTLQTSSRISIRINNQHTHYIISEISDGKFIYYTWELRFSWQRRMWIVVFWVITLNSSIDGYYDSEETMTPPSQLNSTIPSFVTAKKIYQLQKTGQWNNIT